MRLSSDALSAPMEVNVRIPPGVNHGQRIRVAGKGAPSSNGGEPGDLLVTIAIAPHPVFERDGANLLVAIPVTYSEAVLGADVKVPTLSGVPVTVRIKPGTAAGTILRVRGRGVQTAFAAGAGILRIPVTPPACIRVGCVNVSRRRL